LRHCSDTLLRIPYFNYTTTWLETSLTVAYLFSDTAFLHTDIFSQRILKLVRKMAIMITEFWIARQRYRGQVLTKNPTCLMKVGLLKYLCILISSLGYLMHS